MFCLITQLETVAVLSSLRVYGAEATFFFDSGLRRNFGENGVCNKILFSTIKPLYGELLYTNYISSCSEIYGDSDGSKRYLIHYDI